MNRRNFLLMGFAASSGFSASRSKAQTLALPEFVEVPELADQLSDPAVYSRMIADVTYVQSWRAELSPRGYENAEWLAQARNHRESTIRATNGNIPSILDSVSDDFLEYQKAIFDISVENSEAFEEFLDYLGIAPNGLAGESLVRSLRDFTLLSSAANPPGEHGGAEESSYFWPFC